MANGQMLYDEQGKPYFLMPDGTRNYVSPVAMGGQAPADTTGIFHMAPQWNQQSGSWQTPFDFGNLFALGTGAALTGGIANALMGPGAAAIPEAPMVTSSPGTAAAAALGPGEGLGTAGSIGVPAALSNAGVQAAVGGGGAAASGLSKWMGPLLAAAVPTVGRALTGPTTGSASTSGLSPAITQLLAEYLRRQQNQGPLSDAVTAQALGGLPRMK